MTTAVLLPTTTPRRRPNRSSPSAAGRSTGCDRPRRRGGDRPRRRRRPVAVGIELRQRLRPPRAVVAEHLLPQRRRAQRARAAPTWSASPTSRSPPATRPRRTPASSTVTCKGSPTAPPMPISGPPRTPPRPTSRPLRTTAPAPPRSPRCRPRSTRSAGSATRCSRARRCAVCCCRATPGPPWPHRLDRRDRRLRRRRSDGGAGGRRPGARAPAGSRRLVAPGRPAEHLARNGHQCPLRARCSRASGRGDAPTIEPMRSARWSLASALPVDEGDGRLLTARSGPPPDGGA